MNTTALLWTIWAFLAMLILATDVALAASLVPGSKQVLFLLMQIIPVSFGSVAFAKYIMK